MSLQPCPVPAVPEQTSRVAHAAFPKGNPYLRLRDQLGTVFCDGDFADLYPRRGQPALSLWRLALVTVMPFREGLSDRRAADAIRARIDWKYLLGMELTDPGFDHSVLSEFRGRLLTGEAQERLLERLLDRCKALDLVKARGRQRTDATHVLASVRALNRLELLAETLRAALNELSTIAPEWVRGVAPSEWYKRYGRRIEDTRLPHKREEREAYAEAVGRDGFLLLDRLNAPETPAELRGSPQVHVLRSVWERHYQRGGTPEGVVARLRPEGELPPSSEGIESPYDPEARYRSKHGLHWTGHVAHLTETCDGRPSQPDHAGRDDHGDGARGEPHRADPEGVERRRPAPGRAPRRRGVREPPSCSSTARTSVRSGWWARRGRTRAGRTGPRGRSASSTSRSTGSVSRRVARRVG